ncbi:MAG: hypothetical protein B7Y39_16400 [Bdellovibrio sp. 28-41-41]|nr:MAG: hypothetical protein B7Y39_16400 [Bdellovibrio sp. 28-41-41]
MNDFERVFNLNFEIDLLFGNLTPDEVEILASGYDKWKSGVFIVNKVEFLDGSWFKKRKMACRLFEPTIHL